MFLVRNVNVVQIQEEKNKGMLAKIKIVIQGFIVKKRIERLKQKVEDIRGEE